MAAFVVNKITPLRTIVTQVPKPPKKLSPRSDCWRHIQITLKRGRSCKSFVEKMDVSLGPRSIPVNLYFHV